MSDWNPTLYSKFEAERMRAARDLLADVPLAAADLVYDLGCGPGNSAELLLRRFPHARTIGLDTSVAMLAHARIRAPKAEFVKQDIAHWTPEDRPDLIFANAALQFLPDHDRLFPRLMSYLKPGGALAAQMPNTAREVLARAHAHGRRRRAVVDPSRPDRQDAAPDRRLRGLLRLAAPASLASRRMDHDLCASARRAAEHSRWFAGSTLQPFLERLDDDERCEFLARYRKGLKDAYPVQPDGRTLFAYPRLFVIAVKA